MIHVLKCWPEQFEEIRIGAKAVEIRRDDRTFSAGDVLRLREMHPGNPAAGCGQYTGRTLDVQVTYCFRPHHHPAFFQGDHGHLAVMQIRLLPGGGSS